MRLPIAIWALSGATLGARVGLFRGDDIEPARGILPCVSCLVALILIALILVALILVALILVALIQGASIQGASIQGASIPRIRSALTR